VGVAKDLRVWEKVWILIDAAAQFKAVIEPSIGSACSHLEQRSHFYQWGRTIFMLSFLIMTLLQTSESMVNATMCVTILETFAECSPPMARTPPMIASLSPSGKSAQQITTSDMNNRGSELYWRGLASFDFAREASTHCGLITGRSASDAAS
jgi:hypothetical protein